MTKTSRSRLSQQLEHIDDSELVSAIHAHEQDSSRARLALAELLRRHYDWIYRLCLFEIRDEAEASDCVQEIMVEISKSIGSFRKESQCRTWLYTLSKRRLLRFKKQMRKTRHRFPLGKEDDITSYSMEAASEKEHPEKKVLEKSQNEALLKKVAELPERQRHAVYLHYFEDLSLEEVSEQLQCSIGTLKSHLFRARAKLKEFFEDT